MEIIRKEIKNTPFHSFLLISFYPSINKLRFLDFPLQINPEKPEAILQLGISHELCEEYDLALMIYQKLIENSPGFLKAYDHKSTLLMKLDRYQEASKVLNELIKLNPEYYRAYVGIAICFDKLGKKSDAQRYYRKFLIMKPFSHQAQFVKNRLLKLKSLSSKKQNLKLVE